MSACCCDEKCSFCMLLSEHLSEVNRINGQLWFNNCMFYSFWDDFLSTEHLYSISEIFEANDFDIRNDGGFLCVFFGKKYPSHSELSCEDRGRKSSLNWSNDSIECELSKKERIFKNFLLEGYFLSENAECNRKIIDRSLFSEICGSKIDRDPSSAGKSIS